MSGIDQVSQHADSHLTTCSEHTQSQQSTVGYSKLQDMRDALMFSFCLPDECQAPEYLKIGTPLCMNRRLYSSKWLGSLLLASLLNCIGHYTSLLATVLHPGWRSDPQYHLELMGAVMDGSHGGRPAEAGAGADREDAKTLARERPALAGLGVATRKGALEDSPTRFRDQACQYRAHTELKACRRSSRHVSGSGL